MPLDTHTRIILLVLVFWLLIIGYRQFNIFLPAEDKIRLYIKYQLVIKLGLVLNVFFLFNNQFNKNDRVSNPEYVIILLLKYICFGIIRKSEGGFDFISVSYSIGARISLYTIFG